MIRHILRLTLLAMCSIFAILLIQVPTALALIPSDTHYVKYINADWTVSYYATSNEAYVYDTLPNEWIASWTAEALKAGAVIIRSGAYWRVNRTVLSSSYPNNNCYKVVESGLTLYVTAPSSRGGHENWIPNSRQSSTNSATDDTYQYHAERVSLPSGRPDKLVSLRYNSTIQTRTRDGSGTWLDRVRYAYTGSGHPGNPYNPNVDCSQSDDQTSSDPTYPNS